MTDAGYWIEPLVISDAECEALLAAVSHRSGSRAGTRHLMSLPAVSAIAHDQRMVAIARKALGTTAIPFRATLFEKSGEKNWLIAWHQDTALPMESKFDMAGWGPWSEKVGVIYAHAPASALSQVIALRLHLDESSEQNGPLRVIPGSHTGSVLTDEEILRIADRHEAVCCPIPRGGVLAMRPLLIHASSKAVVSSPRRVLHLEYADSLDMGRGMRLRIV